MKKSIGIVSGAILTPFIASAAVFTPPATNVGSLATWLSQIFNVATTLILSAAVVFFLFGVFQFVMSAGDEDARKEGRSHIIYGLIGIAVMVSVWGLVNFFTNSLGATSNIPIAAPTVQPV